MDSESSAMVDGTFGDVRSVVQRGVASERAWVDLLGLMERLGEVEGALDYVVDHVEREWPAALRRAPRRWVEGFVKGEPVALAPLAKVLELGRYEDEYAWYWSAEEVRLDAYVEPLGDDMLSELLADEGWSNLSGLSVRAQEMGPKSIGVLACAPHLCAVTSLDVRGNFNNGELFGALVDGMFPVEQLEELGIEGDVVRSEARRFMDPGVTGGVRTLRLMDATLFDERALDGVPLGGALGGVRVLDLSQSYLEDAELEVMLERFEWPELRSLNLSQTSLTDEMWGRIAQVPWAERLEAVDLSSNDRISPRTVQLFERGALRAVRSLNLGGTEVGMDSVWSLLESGSLEGLEHLDITALESTSPLNWFELDARAPLVSMSVGFDEEWEAVVHWLKAPFFSTLRQLELGGTFRSPTSAMGRLFDHAWCVPRLEHLGLAASGVTDADIEGMCMGFARPGLRTLDLRANEITDDGARVLAGCAALAGLEVLDLRYNRGLTGRGRQVLYDSAVWSGCALRT
ncbi:MAG: hypothetical protein AAGI01_04340 [Myxococcota bacterium]